MKRCTLVSCSLILAAVLFAASVSVSPARAELYVIESTAAAIRVGSQLGDSDTLNVPAGSYIRTVLPSGKTRTIRGPYNGSVADLAKGQAQNDGVMSWVRNILQTGLATEQTPGATRAIGPRTAPVPASFSWVDIPVTVNGSVCVEKGAKLQLVRAGPSSPDRVTLVDVTSSTRAEAQWPAGSTKVAWPDGVQAQPEGSYLLLIETLPRRQIMLRVLERLPAEDDVLTALEQRGCKYQFEAWVRERMAASKRNP